MIAADRHRYATLGDIDRQRTVERPVAEADAARHLRLLTEVTGEEEVATSRPRKAKRFIGVLQTSLLNCDVLLVDTCWFCATGNVEVCKHRPNQHL